MTAPRFLMTALLACIGPSSQGETRAAASSGSADIIPAVSCIQGRTVRWTWRDGPTAGATHEHAFRLDGSVTWRVISGPQEGHTGDEKAYAAFDVSDSVCAVSYLAASGHTLTVVLNMESGEMYGFASSEDVWFPARGTFEMIR